MANKLFNSLKKKPTYGDGGSQLSLQSSADKTRLSSELLKLSNEYMGFVMLYLLLLCVWYFPKIKKSERKKRKRKGERPQEEIKKEKKTKYAADDIIIV